MTNPILTVTKEIASSLSHPKSYQAKIEISVISRYHGNCYRENIKLPITVAVTHVHYRELSVLRKTCPRGAEY